MILLLHYCIHLEAADNDLEDPPEGYYAFIESPNAEPPRVRPPPYTHVLVDCREDDSRSPQGSLFNLCGDLNKGTIPKNPMGQNVLGSPYPFELIRNMTLKYLSRTLPILKADETLPKVAQLQDDYISQNSLYTQHPNDRSDRSKRSANSTDPPVTAAPANATSTAQVSSRQARKFCDQGGVFCMLYKAINGESSGPATSQLPLERRDEAPLAQPRCLQARCHYLDGGCLSSPRWSSLLVAEIYYPDTVLSSSDTTNPQRSPVAASQPPSVQDFQNYQQYLHKRAGLQPIDAGTTQRPSSQCDGIDALGCFQVRLYYDWFLIPGSCKCWRPDYFNKYVRRKSNTDL
ncbi:unnamed protein product [Diabrotica balteata]|uniref:Uncharacterized protein n=1 Tax=Diabrotica balteata TaxID=107213 RepID=A0A9N9T5X6_DIABA|nr:unnamed protein product [Diabrotica balteata]